MPMTGGLVLVPDDAIIPVPEMKVDDLLRVYFSLGALAPDCLPKNLQGDMKTPPANVPTIEAAREMELSRDAAE
jgi:uncharacterized membrane protein